MAYTSEIEKLERRHQENPKGRTFAILADHYRKAGEFDRALALLNDGLEVHPDYPSALIVLGRCHADMSEDAEAERAFRRVLDLDHENGIALRAMADMAERHGRHAEARRWLETLLAIDSGNEGARAQLNRVSEAIVAPSAEIDPVLDEEARSEPEPIELYSFPDSGEQPETPDTPSLLEETPPAGEPLEVEKLDLEATDLSDGEDMDIGVIRAEEIVLRPSQSTEYQVASDSDSLMDDLARGEQEAAPPGSDESFDDEPEMGHFERNAVHPYSPQMWEMPESSQSPAESETAAPADELRDGWEGSFPAAEDSSGEEPSRDESPAISGDSSGGPAPDWWQEEGGSIEAETDSGEQGAGSGEEEESDEMSQTGTEGGEQGGAFGITETLAGIYLTQGHHREAADVYRQLLAKHPGNSRLQEKLAEVEAKAMSGTRAGRISYSAGSSGGQSVEGYFAALLAASPAPEDSTPETPEVDSDSGAARPPGTAAPTRPATDSLTLSAIFGEDGPEGRPPPPPDHKPGAPPAAPGMSFDEFFGPGGDRSPARPSRTSSRGDEEDLTQFHDWLKSLKS